MAEETEQEIEQNDLLAKYPNYEYYLDLFNSGKWELEIIETGETEIGIIDWAEMNLRNPEHLYRIPDGAPYEFDFNTGLSFIK